MTKERAEEECISLGEAYDEGYEQGKADKEKELSELPNQYSEKLWKNAYDKGRADAFEECIAYFSEHASEVYKHISARDFICDRLEQLKEQMNDRAD